MPEPYYTTADALRTELGVDSTVLPDARATSLITDAEDIIDALLGAGIPDSTTGRKIVQTDVETWQWTKLSRATLKLAARLYLTPSLLDPQWRSVSGPDFSFSGPIGTKVGPIILTLLNDSRLRRLTGRARPGRRGNRALANSFFNRDSNDPDHYVP